MRSGNAGLETLDPCTLLTVEEFARFAGGRPPAAPMPLEDGEACGFINEADDTRVAIGVIAAPGNEADRFVPKGAGGETLDDDIGIAVSALRWISNYPIEQSDTLVAETPSFDLVVEISSRRIEESGLKQIAIDVARLAAKRIPGATR